MAGGLFSHLFLALPADIFKSRYIEREGDREYIAPEVLESHRYDKPADVFSLGIMMFEIAANIVLPDNGLPWQKLRSGDLSDAPRLSNSDPLDFEHRSSSACGSAPEMTEIILPDEVMDLSDSSNAKQENIHDNNINNNDGQQAFIPKAFEHGSLDRVVRSMLSPDPNMRPTIHDVLCMEEVKWVEYARKAGAVIYEGDYGPVELDASLGQHSGGRDNEDDRSFGVDEDWRMEL